MQKCIYVLRRRNELFYAAYYPSVRYQFDEMDGHFITLGFTVINKYFQNKKKGK